MNNEYEGLSSEELMNKLDEASSIITSQQEDIDGKASTIATINKKLKKQTPDEKFISPDKFEEMFEERYSERSKNEANSSLRESILNENDGYDSEKVDIFISKWLDSKQISALMDLDNPEKSIVANMNNAWLNWGTSNQGFSKISFADYSEMTEDEKKQYSKMCTKETGHLSFAR